MTRQGQPVRYVRATIIPGDEAFMATFEATSETLVREAYVRAGRPARADLAGDPARRPAMNAVSSTSSQEGAES